jgi:hypothetical protein
MFTTVPSNVRVVSVQCGMKKTQKNFRKFGKRLAKQRRAELNLMGQRVKDIARDEERRARELANDHREFIESLISQKSEDEDATDVSFFDLE